MFRFLKRHSKRRGAWLLLTLSALTFEGIALYFQHGMDLKPCVLCIYERCAMFGLAIAGIVGFIKPRPMRFPALAIWIYSAIKGISLSYEHVMLQLNPSPFATCDFMARFPEWLPLDKWLPSVFVASGDCAEKQWQFLGLDMPQWLLIIFSVSLIVAILVLVSQVKNTRRRIFS